MKPAGPRIAALLGAVLALAACGTTASPSASAQASGTNEPASQPQLVAVVCQPAPQAFDPTSIDLTGPWAGDDGGIYYLRQLGSVLWWNGMSGREGSPFDPNIDMTLVDAAEASTRSTSAAIGTTSGGA